jgi:hypothetical protein
VHFSSLLQQSPWGCVRASAQLQRQRAEGGEAGVEVEVEVEAAGRWQAAGGTCILYLVFGSLCVALLYIYRRDSAIFVSACALVQLTEARSSSRTQHALQYYALI